MGRGAKETRLSAPLTFQLMVAHVDKTNQNNASKSRGKEVKQTSVSCGVHLLHFSARSKQSRLDKRLLNILSWHTHFHFNKPTTNSNPKTKPSLTQPPPPPPRLFHLISFPFISVPQLHPHPRPRPNNNSNNNNSNNSNNNKVPLDGSDPVVMRQSSEFLSAVAPKEPPTGQNSPTEQEQEQEQTIRPEAKERSVCCVVRVKLPETATTAQNLLVSNPTQLRASTQQQQQEAPSPNNHRKCTPSSSAQQRFGPASSPPPSSRNASTQDHHHINNATDQVV